MALEYGLYIQTDLHPEQALKLMFTGIGVDARIEKSNKRKVFISTNASGLTTYAYRFKDNDPCYIAADLGIETSMLILFHLDPFEDREIQKHILLQVTIELLREVKGDTVLLFNGEVVWLLRKAGELILNSSKDLWRPDFLFLVTLPYKMKDLPTL
ncbi:hypothetical protein IH992_34240 [Candidatus Poribacteria bacterium]|nr:hypothetical protein [Candidatus Poribacteria bacterium]